MVKSVLTSKIAKFHFKAASKVTSLIDMEGGGGVWGTFTYLRRQSHTETFILWYNKLWVNGKQFWLLAENFFYYGIWYISFEGAAFLIVLNVCICNILSQEVSGKGKNQTIIHFWMDYGHSLM